VFAILLDVGSGTPSKFHQFLIGEKIIHADIDKKAFHLEVVCDIHNLPFKTNSFNVVHASHILEHVNNPLKAIKELKRVSNGIVIIKVPNASFYKWKGLSSDHIFSWNEFTLHNLLSRLFPKVRINGTTRQIKMSKLNQFFKLIISLFYGRDQLTAVCYIEKVHAVAKKR